MKGFHEEFQLKFDLKKFHENGMISAKNSDEYLKFGSLFWECAGPVSPGFLTFERIFSNNLPQKAKIKNLVPTSMTTSTNNYGQFSDL